MFRHTQANKNLFLSKGGSFINPESSWGAGWISHSAKFGASLAIFQAPLIAWILSNFTITWKI